MPELLYSATICCYNSCAFDDIKILCVNDGECLCFTMQDCIAANTPPIGIGLVTDSSKGEICALGLFCCRRGLKVPTVLCASKQHCLFCKNAASFPFSPDFVKGPMCAICFISLYPKQGVLLPPGAPAIEIDDAVEDEKIERS